MPDEHDDRDFDALAQRLAEAERELSTMRITLLESNAALHASQERLRRALEVAKMEHWVWNPKTDVVIRSQSIADLDALNEGEAAHGASDFFVLVHPDDRARHEKLVRAAGESGVGWHTEVRIVRPNSGEVGWMEERTAHPIDPLTGEAIIIGFTWDITERKKTEAELRKREADLARVQRIGQVGGMDIDIANGMSSQETRNFGLSSGCILAMKDVKGSPRRRSRPNQGRTTKRSWCRHRVCPYRATR